MLLELGMTHEFGQAPLPFGKLGFVSALLQLLRQIERAQDVEAVDLARHRRRDREVLIALVGEAVLQRIEHDLADGQRTIAVVRSFDDNPRRPRRVGHAQDVPGRFLQLVVSLETGPALLGHAPGRAGIALERLQSLPLAILRQMEPELDHQRAFVDQHGLEAINLIHVLIEIALRQLAANPLGDRVRVP